jgi:pimeloyl-ACP methyl ester carboxylesterase
LNPENPANSLTHRNLYLISGLGADRRAFARLRLPERYTIHHVEWIKPERGEGLESYAQRLAEVVDTSHPFALVGLSFGGMIASAMSSFLRPEKTLLISSIGCVSELPPYLRFAGALRLHYLVPRYLLNHPNKAAHWLFGARTKKEKELLDLIIGGNHPEFMRWAFHAILTWKQKERPAGLQHIHGTADRILPVRYTHPTTRIEGGSHFMVWTRAGDVSKWMEEVLG